MNQGGNHQCNWVGIHPKVRQVRMHRCFVPNNSEGPFQLHHHAPSSHRSAKEPKDYQKNKEKENFLQVLGSANDLKPSTNKDDVKVGENGRVPGFPKRGVSSNLYASGSSQNTGNVITDRPTSKVTQPPGGKSSISFY